MILVVYELLMLGFLTHSSGKCQTFSRGGKPNKGKGPTDALVDGSKWADCFNRSLQKATGAGSTPGSLWVSFRVNLPFGVCLALHSGNRGGAWESKRLGNGGGRSSGLATEAKTRTPDSRDSHVRCLRVRVT